MVDAILDEANPMGPPRFLTLLLGVFAGVALMTAAVGLYGVISFAVGRRTHEIGVRMALGAGGGAVKLMVVRQAMLPVLGGIVVGSMAALACSRFLASQLYQVRPNDPLTFGVVVLILIGVGALAALVPARRAARVDPAVALRGE